MKRLVLFVLPLFMVSAAASGQLLTLDAATADLSGSLRAVQTGDSLRLEGVRGGLGAFDLERFEVFTADAQIVVHRESGDEILPAPDNVYFRGSIVGDPSSRVVLSVLENGVRGVVMSSGRAWLVGRGAAANAPEALLEVVEVDPGIFAEQASRFSCPSGELIPPAERTFLNPGPAPIPTAVSATYEARIAVETDNEYLSLFSGNTTSATNYAADLIAYGSTMYSDEVDTSMLMSSISLWTVADPWVQSSTLCGLFEFGRYWNNNNTGISRTIAHYMSGKGNGGGVAWVGVLCNGAFTYDHGGACPTLTPQVSNYGGDYGYSGDMDGNFDINNPAVIWDIVVTTHEMGHNFNSPHTHCYAGLGGNPADIDHCYGIQAGCYSGATSLPSGCPGGGQGCGTIMSYCHLLSPGISNIAYTLGNPGGTPHIYGVAPERVPTRMNAHVVSTAGGNPACLAPSAAIFSDGFESGDTSFWTAVP